MIYKNICKAEKIKGKNGSKDLLNYRKKKEYICVI